MNIDIFIPARLDSRRLEKKHLQQINKIPAIEHLVNRLKNCKNFSNIIVCTTNRPTDDALVNFLKEKKILFFRGDEKNILKRFHDAAKKFNTDVIIDVEGDKLFIEPNYVDKIILQMKSHDYDFLIGSNSLSSFDPNDHFVHGIIPTAIRTSCLKQISELNINKNKETGYKELFINNSKIKKKFFVLDTSKLDIPKNLRLTLDYPEDLEFTKKLFSKLKNNFSYQDVLDVLKNNPDFLKIIQNLHERWRDNYNKEISNNL